MARTICELKEPLFAFVTLWVTATPTGNAMNDFPEDPGLRAGLLEPALQAGWWRNSHRFQEYRT
jgi:hypothetical protein